MDERDRLALAVLMAIVDRYCAPIRKLDVEWAYAVADAVIAYRPKLSDATV